MKHYAQSKNQRPKVKFVSETLPAYYRSEVSSIEQKQDNTWLIKTSVPGLSGNQGVIPRSINKQAMSALFEEDEHAAIDFFNAFNNRYYRLHCATQNKHNLVDLLEEETFAWNASDYQQSISQMLLNLTGVMPDAGEIPDNHFIQYASIIGMKLSCPNMLVNLLNDYFSYEFEVEHSPLEYQPLTDCSLTHIGRSGQNQALGMGALVGRKAAVVAQKLKIKICPASRQEYLTINENQRLIKAIYQMAKAYIGVNVSLSLYMKVKGKYLPGLKLTENSASGLKLGESTWMDGNSSVNQYVEMPLKAS